MNLPNTITFARLILTICFVAVASWHHSHAYLLAGILFIIAAWTDWLDGWLARKMNLVTPLGKLMDPLVDKILVSTAFILLTEKSLCPVWICALIISREFFVTGLRQVAIEQGEVLAADRLGKWKTTFQLAFCIMGILHLWLNLQAPPSAFWQGIAKLCHPHNHLLNIILYLATALTFISGWNYFLQTKHYFQNKK